MKDKLILHLKALKMFLKGRSLQQIKFWLYEQELDVSKYDDDMLIAQLCYFGHHTEKALKHHDRGERGKLKRKKLELLLQESKLRSFDEPEVLEWAENLIEHFDECTDIYITPIENNAEHVQREEILSFVKSRATTRFWQPKQIDNEIIDDILNTALTSAISCNRQTIRFSVVRNSIDNMCLGDSNNNSMLNKAPTIIYVAEDERFFTDLFETALDVGSVCSTLLTAAHFYGIQGTWIYQPDYYSDMSLRDKLGFSKNHKIYSVITLGYPCDKQVKPPRFRAKICRES